MKNYRLLRGALTGLVVGVLALVVAYAAAVQCLPYFISMPNQPWPWYCTPSTYATLQYLVFPMNVMTNDLATAAKLAPLTVVLYALIGALLGKLFGRKA